MREKTNLLLSDFDLHIRSKGEEPKSRTIKQVSPIIPLKHQITDETHQLKASDISKLNHTDNLLMCYCIKTVRSQTGEMSGKDFFFS